MVEMGSGWMGIVGICVAIIIIFIGGAMLRRGGWSTFLPVLCGVAYVMLELDWMGTNQAAAVGALRDYAWSLVELGFMVWIASRLANSYFEGDE